MILDGKVDVTFKYKGLDITCCTLSPNSFFGEVNILNNTNSQFTYEAAAVLKLEGDHEDEDYEPSKAFSMKSEHEGKFKKEEKQNIVKDKVRLLLIKKAQFLNILSKYDKALEKFKMISLFRDNYFSKLRSNIKSRLEKNFHSFISLMEKGDESVMNGFHGNNDLVTFVKERFFSDKMVEEEVQPSQIKDKTDNSFVTADKKPLLSPIKDNQKKNDVLSKKSILNEINQKFSLLSTNYTKFDDITHDLYSKLLSLNLFKTGTSYQSRSKTID